MSRSKEEDRIIQESVELKRRACIKTEPKSRTDLARVAAERQCHDLQRKYLTSIWGK